MTLALGGCANMTAEDWHAVNVILESVNAGIQSYNEQMMLQRRYRPVQCFSNRVGYSVYTTCY